MQALHNADFTFKNTERLMRRVQGDHDLRLDGVSDILSRARGASVIDIGSNRGRVCDEFARNGAVRCLGLDNYEDGIVAARHLFADYRTVDHRFEVVDLSKGAKEVARVLGKDADLHHDIAVYLAVVHKLRRIMDMKAFNELMRWFTERTDRFIVWRGYDTEIPVLDGMFVNLGFNRVQTSTIATIQTSAIWSRK